jgi:hypothetical protein
MLPGLPRRAAAWSIAAWLCACAPARSGPCPPSAPPEPPPSGPIGEQDLAAQIQCRVEPGPAPPRVAPAPACVAVPDPIQRRIHAAIARRHTDLEPGERLVTRFDCDPLGTPVELVYEAVDLRGDQHILHLTRLRWQGGKIEAVGLTLLEDPSRRFAYYGGAFDPAEHRLVLDFGAVPATLDVPELHALLLAHPAVVKPPPLPGRKGGGGYSVRVRDLLHTRVRLRDAAGHTRERVRVVGPELDMLPMRMLGEAIEPTVRRIDHNGKFDLEGLQAFFVEHFLATVPPITARPWQRARWAGQWQNQALVRIASTLGTTALIPALVDLARHDIDTDGHRLVRHHALVALAALTKFDARRDRAGRQVTDTEAAELYARACAAHLPPPAPPPPVFSPDQPGPPD